MGTARFREDVSAALKKFARINPGQTPQTLKVNYQDAMDWHTGERSRLPLNEFVTTLVQAYVDTIPWQKSTLRSPAELLNVEDGSPTQFE